MNFSKPRSIENINLIYHLLVKEPRDAYDLADEMCCSKPLMTLYLLHMRHEGMIEEIKTGKRMTFKAIPGAIVPSVPAMVIDEDQTEARREARDAKKKKIKLSQIKPWRDPLLFILFGTPSQKE
jgi:hypothetical protein